MIPRYVVLISLCVSFSSCASDEATPIDARSGTQSSGPSTEALSSSGDESTTETRTVLLLDETHARKLAADFANRELADRKFFMPSGEMEPLPPINPIDWHSVIYVYRDNRIWLRMGGSGGPEATVSFLPDGSEPKLEHADFAWD